MAEQQPYEASYWDPASVPSKNDAFFQSITGSERRLNSQPTESECMSWESPPNPETYSSIGDNGVTASINAYGELMQFTRYLGIGTPGLFCVDQSFSYSTEPYFVRSRASDLQSLSHDRISSIGGSFGLRFPDILISDNPHLSYLRYRWPRFEYSHENLKFSAQWMVHDDVVLQQCVVTNLSGNDVNVPFTFANPEQSIAIRDLDYLDSGNRFNDSYKGYSESFGPNGFSWVVVHKLSSTADDASSTSSNLEGNDKQPPSGAVAVIISVFLDGSALKWNDRAPSWEKTLKSRRNTADEGVLSTMEVMVAYKMIFLPSPTAHWQNFTISAASIQVDKFLAEEPFSDISISTIEVAVDDTTSESMTPVVKHKPSIRQTSTPRSTPSQSTPPSNHIEFVTRRNLEHILSVCAIPLITPILKSEQTLEDTYPQPNDALSVALTCGDVSGHRICTSAS